MAQTGIGIHDKDGDNGDDRMDRDDGRKPSPFFVGAALNRLVPTGP